LRQGLPQTQFLLRFPQDAEVGDFTERDVAVTLVSFAGSTNKIRAFDQGTPVPLRRHLAHHTVVTVFEKGWNTLQNGELLDAAEREGIAVLVTTDQS
jgi:hypothetical protein